MTAPDTETLTAALRRLADEHASGLLSVATSGRDVVLELADGIPVGIGPNHGASDRVGRDAGAELVAAAVVDDLIDRTVAAIVGGGGDWTWDVGGDTAMLPVPQGLATELSRRAVDAAQALAMLEPEQVLLPGRDLETHGEVDRVRRLFDGERTLTDVAEEIQRPLPATATLAAALVASGVLATGEEDPGPVSWTDAVAATPTGADDDEDDDEPELWVMDAPEDDEDDEHDEDDEDDDLVQSVAPAAHDAGSDQAAARPEALDRPGPAPAEQPVAEAGPATADAEPAADAEPTAAEPTAADKDEDDWADTTWLDDLDGADQGVRTARDEVATDATDRTGTRGDGPEDARAALSAMISEFNGPGRSGPAAAPAQEDAEPEPSSNGTAADAGTTDDDDAAGDGDTSQRVSSEARRKEPKAAPGEVAEFLRELSRLALDED